MSFDTTSPSIKTCPFVGRINPLIRRISIVLPEPFIPRRPITRPRSEQRDTFLITTSPCIDFVTFFTSRNIRIPPCLKYPYDHKRRNLLLSMLNLQATKSKYLPPHRLRPHKGGHFESSWHSCQRKKVS